MHGGRNTNGMKKPYSPSTIRGTLASIFTSIPLTRVLVRRDLRLQYHSSILGYLWSLIEPLMLAATYYFVFIIIRGTADELYPLLVLTGILIWSLFTKTFRYGVNSMVKNAGLIQQVHFPHSTLIVAKCGTNYVITALSMLVLIPFMIAYEIRLTLQIFFIFYGFLMTGLLAMGLGFMLAPVNVRYRDIDHLTGFMVRIGFFLTPIMYTMAYIPEKYHWWYLLLNPMAVNISVVRAGILGQPLLISTQSILYSFLTTVSILWLGLYVYSKMKNKAVKYL
jgi:ABC-type polysaccharide/polyol phosphate export permease